MHISLNQRLEDNLKYNCERSLLLFIFILFMDSKELAKYIQATNGMSKPWLWLQLRLKKLQERKSTMPLEEYLREVEDLHQDLMKLGEWWKGIEDEAF